MSGLRTLARLEAPERTLLLGTLLVVIVIRIGLCVLPFLRLQRFIRSWRYLPFPVPRDTPVARLVWAVQAASRRVPMASCLTQSLALQFMLARAGHPSQLRIGIHKDLNMVFTPMPGWSGQAPRCSVRRPNWSAISRSLPPTRAGLDQRARGNRCYP